MKNEYDILNFTDKLILHFYKNRYLKGKAGYHPLPWLGISESERKEGCHERLNALLEFLKISRVGNGVVLDVGCNVGFFSLSLKEKGFCVYGADENKFFLTVADIIGRSIKKGNFLPINISVDKKVVEFLPPADICLCLSIWHHWVKKQGLTNATAILKSLFKKTRKILFFETSKPRAINDFSVKKYLVKTLNTNHIFRLGESIPPETSPQKVDIRELFAVIK
ncbi:MAG: hypothetical protein Q8Q08_05070 [Candidatus Omnitrophota bacterium]|nr:hypothetical protein [Candidatus Omnitrophota bacterium]